MGTKATYDKAKVLEIIAAYFFAQYSNGISSLPFETVYRDIVVFAEKEYPKTQMPKFSQMRKTLIKHLSDYNKYTQGERLSTAVASRITEIYINSDKIEDMIDHGDYQVTIHAGSPIICTIKLPPAELLDSLAEGLSDAKKRSLTWGRVNVINRICRRIKKKNPDLILAVIPEFNRMMYLNENGKIDKTVDSFNPICDSLCMFVKNTEEGRELIYKMRGITVPQTDSKMKK